MPNTRTIRGGDAIPVALVDAEGDLIDGGTTPVDGTLAATTTAAALGSRACRSVLVQNDPDNTVDILVGDATNQRFQVVPGSAVVIPCSNVSQVYAKTASATGNVNWIAET